MTGTSMEMQGNKDRNSEVIVGFFESADDAQNAIFELRDEGFGPDQVGAAFHSASSYRAARGESSGLEQDTSGIGKDVAFTVSPGVTGAGSGATGPRSDTLAVTPAGLASGSGTTTAGVGRPGPIPGSKVHRTLAGDNKDPYRPIESSAVAPAGGAFPSTGGFSDRDAGKDGPTVWDKVKHFFGASTDKTDAKKNVSRHNPVANKESLNFGTGQGHLGVSQSPVSTAGSASDGGLYENDPLMVDEYEVDDYYAEYPGTELEGSFYGMGVAQERASALSRQISRGGAIVTVKAEGRGDEAESILERNNGRTRHEPATGSDAGDIAYDQSPGQQRVVLFGEVLRIHRNRFDEGNPPSQRKAS